MNGIKFFIALILGGFCSAFLFSLTIESGVFSDNRAKEHADKQLIVTTPESRIRDVESSAEPKKSNRQQRKLDKAHIEDLESRLAEMTSEIARLNELVKSKSITIEDLTTELEVGLSEYARSYIEKQLEEQIKKQIVNQPHVTSSKGIKRLIETELRDELWAYDVETKLTDFIAMSEANGELTVTEMNCRTHSCGFSFSHNDSFEGWDQFQDTLYAQEWWSFKNMHVMIAANSIEMLVTQTPKSQ